MLALKVIELSRLALVIGGIGLDAGGLTDLFKQWTGALANWVEIIAAVIIAVAVVEAAFRAAVLFTRRHIAPYAREELRLRLGRWLAVALEFELAADILRTAIAPTWNEIGLLAAVAAIRTALNYFLEKEIERGARIAAATGTGTPSGNDGAGRVGQRRASEQREREAGHAQPTPA